MAEKLLTQQQVEAVVDFAQGIAIGEKYGYWSPFLTNQLMQNLNSSNSAIPTVEKIRQSLADYKNNADTIQSYMEFTNAFDMLFARTLKSYVNALAFDLQMVCTNAYTQSDYKSDAYKKDKQRVENFLNKFNYKQEFRKITEQVMMNEVYFVSFRKTKWNNQGMKFAIQTLPQDRCLIDGYWEKGLLFSFDMSYFLQAGTDLALYDPSMAEAYYRVFGANADPINYRPSVPLDERKGTYAMYTQLSPLDGYWCFKFDMSNFNTTPFLAPFLKNALANDEIQQLQYNKDMAEAFAILAGEIETFDTAKSGTKADQMVFTPKTLGQFMGKAKAGLSSTVKLAALPVKNLKWYQYTDNNSDMYNQQLASTAGVGTGISRVIYSSDRMSIAEVEAAQNEVYQTMKPLYYQFNNFLDFYVNKITKKYKFKFVLDGATYNYERKSRMDNLFKLADHGIVLNESAFASALGIEPQVFSASIRESKNTDWIQEYSQRLFNINTSKDTSTAGRPLSDNITESGEYKRDRVGE